MRKSLFFALSIVFIRPFADGCMSVVPHEPTTVKPTTTTRTPTSTSTTTTKASGATTTSNSMSTTTSNAMPTTTSDSMMSTTTTQAPTTTTTTMGTTTTTGPTTTTTMFNGPKCQSCGPIPLTAQCPTSLPGCHGGIKASYRTPIFEGCKIGACGTNAGDYATWMISPQKPEGIKVVFMTCGDDGQWAGALDMTNRVPLGNYQMTCEHILGTGP